MQQWQFYLHMLAMCVIILLLYLFLREYKSACQAKRTPPDTVYPHPATHVAATVPRPTVTPFQVPLSHAHLQAMQSMTMSATPAPLVQRFDTESNLDRELAAELHDLDLPPPPPTGDDTQSHASYSSSSVASASSPRPPTASGGSPIRKVIEFVPRPAKRRSKKATADASGAKVE